jgi:hypothetical protein
MMKAFLGLILLEVGYSDMYGLGFTTLYAGIFGKGLFGSSIADIIVM